jgi:uncharacterized membrane protein YhaH (DUF805 family)
MDFLKGRTNRATYWLTVGMCILLYAAFYLITGDHVSISEIVLLLICIPRLHDIGKSGWWSGGLILVQFALLGLAIGLLPLEQAKHVMGVFVLLVAGLMIWLGCVPGQPFANKFGEPPAPGFLWKQAKPKPAAVPEN